uniref:Uncharacterized protein n=1 Tax=Medicago truncatula TaxID=3880 RepID=Q2HTE5_MEDTR|nr:hypothetical protein MtrDRAFT_AC150442g18v2 [Medicago truncatula]
MAGSVGDSSTNSKSVHKMLESQHTQIHVSFQTSMIMVEARFKGKILWYKLIRSILRNTMHFLADETNPVVGGGTYIYLSVIV